ncbi:hypothetical protein QJS10_CPB04g01602 [Acorus calamus]|uniref:Uncharacterized protein n=1 Tax=Acorus calamus TaxID=4465 RepID=A0AAV9EXJ4_ACOCL|nr:hypothetical protein QJS10_CPB04g01602 [Acorus calamus]
MAVDVFRVEVSLAPQKDGLQELDKGINSEIWGCDLQKPILYANKYTLINIDIDPRRLQSSPGFQQQPPPVPTMDGERALRQQVKLMCSYCKKHKETEVPDLYYGGQQGFGKDAYVQHK